MDYASVSIEVTTFNPERKVKLTGTLSKVVHDKTFEIKILPDGSLYADIDKPVEIRIFVDKMKADVFYDEIYSTNNPAASTRNDGALKGSELCKLNYSAGRSMGKS